MYPKLLTAMLLVALMSISFSDSIARDQIKSSGIGLRWATWNMGNNSTFLTYIEEDGREYIETGGVGGWLYFTSRASDYWNIEFAIGAFGKAEGESHQLFDDDDFEGTAVIPVVLGLQREFLPAWNTASLRPYVQFGGGPYWITDVVERDRFNNRQVVSKIEPGIYFGGGVNFFLGRSFAINFDGRYHLVDVNLDHELSGLEVGLGFSILWGNYRSSKP